MPRSTLAISLATLTLAIGACGDGTKSDDSPRAIEPASTPIAPQSDTGDVDCAQETIYNEDGTVREVSGGIVGIERGVTIDGIELVSMDDTYRLTVSAEPTRVETNRLFELHVTIADADGTPIGAPAVTLSVDAAMPHHEHGLNTTPRVSASGDGFVAEGLIFHMPGKWEVYFDIEDRGIIERAILELVVR
jgi:hypothetical protein